MKTCSAIFATVFACLPVMAGEYQSVAEFTPGESEKLNWRIVDDGVMGGLSQGKREIGKDGKAEQYQQAAGRSWGMVHGRASR